MNSGSQQRITKTRNIKKAACLLNAKGFIQYPCCPKEKVMVGREATGQVSQKCPRCGKFAIFDYKEMKAYPSEPVRGATQQLSVRG